MPTTGDRPEDKLIDLFLTVYEERTWAGSLSSKESPERIIDGGVEMIATRSSEGRKLAIEHTLIEPSRLRAKGRSFNHFRRRRGRARAREISLKIWTSTATVVVPTKRASL